MQFGQVIHSYKKYNVHWKAKKTFLLQLTDHVVLLLALAAKLTFDVFNL